MSRTEGMTVGWPRRFPRVSGDEPFIDGMWAGIKSFSPRERG